MTRLFSRPVAKASVLAIAALLALGGPVRGDDAPPDQAAIDCARGDAGHDYVGGDWELHVQAAGIWAFCLLGHEIDYAQGLAGRVRRLEREDYDYGSDQSDEIDELEGETRVVVRLAKASGVIKDAADELEEVNGAARVTRLLRRMQTLSYSRGVPWRETSCELYSHTAEASALYRGAVEQSIAERAVRLAALEGPRIVRLQRKGQALFVLAAGIGDRLDKDEFDMLGAFLTLQAAHEVVTEQDKKADRKEWRRAKRSYALLFRTQKRTIARYHNGIKVLLRLDRKLAALVAKAERLSSKPDPDPDPDPEPGADCGGPAGFLNYTVNGGDARNIQLDASRPGDEWSGNLDGGISRIVRVEGIEPNRTTPTRRLAFEYAQQFNEPQVDITTTTYDVRVRFIDPAFPGHPNAAWSNNFFSGPGWEGTGTMTLTRADPHVPDNPTPNAGGDIAGTFSLTVPIGGVTQLIEGSFAACAQR